jgi:hypothetical protein
MNLILHPSSFILSIGVILSAGKDLNKMKISNIAYGGNVKCQAIVPMLLLRGFDPRGVS